MFFFGKATTSVLQVDFFFRVGQISFNLTCTFGVHHGKSFVPTLFFFIISINHLFYNLDSGEKKKLFWKKSGKNLESWILKSV